MKNLIFMTLLFVGCSAAQQQVKQPNSIIGGDNTFTTSSTTIKTDTVDKAALIDSIKTIMRKYYIKGIYAGIHIKNYLEFRAANQDTITEKEYAQMCQDAVDMKNIWELYPIMQDTTTVNKR